MPTYLVSCFFFPAAQFSEWMRDRFELCLGVFPAAVQGNAEKGSRGEVFRYGYLDLQGL